MREDIKSLIRKRRHCVLATASENKPYCSLMAYSCNDDCSRIFMATYRNTRKFKNLKENPKVSLLIDSRDSANAQALTIEGACEEIDDKPEANKIRSLLLNDHPQLIDFLDHPDAAFIRIRPKSLVFLNGLTEAYHETVS